MKKHIFLTLLCAATTIVSCEKENNNNNTPDLPPDPSKGKVLVAGARNNSSGSIAAALWVDGKVLFLDNSGEESTATSVYVSGEDTYVAGSIDGFAALWKNGIATTLTDGTQTGIAKSVYVSGNDVYVVGEEHKRGSDNIQYMTLTIWKNGIPTVLSKDIRSGRANAIIVSDDKVYVVGSVDNGTQTVAMLWINGEKFQLSDDKDLRPGEANGIIVSGTDVYIVGARDGKPVLWRNNKNNMTILDDSGSATSLVISDGKFYITGEGAVLWTKPVVSGTVTSQSFPETSFILSIAASGSDIYMAGYKTGEKYIAQMWKNGVLTNLSDGSGYATASSVFVR